MRKASLALQTSAIGFKCTGLKCIGTLLSEMSLSAPLHHFGLNCFLPASLLSLDGLILIPLLEQFSSV